MPQIKTNAARILDGLDVQYSIRTYDVDEADLSAVNVAQKIGLPADQVFKTLFLSAAGGGYLFGVLPGNQELDLKVLAKLAGTRSVEPVPLAKLQALTGYLRGAVTVLGAKSQHPIFVDETIRACDTISISAGKRGLQILLRPDDFLRATKATVAKITKQAPRSGTEP